MEKPKYFFIEEKFANEIIKYLASRPYIEVYNLIAGMQGLQKFEEKPMKVEQIKK